jgi:hypothetical protein
MSATTTVHPNKCAAYFAEVGNPGDNAIRIKFSNTLTWSTSIPSYTAFSVSFSGGAVSVSSISVAGEVDFAIGQLEVNINRNISIGETGTITYTKPVTNPLLDSIGNQIPSFTLTVTNSVN